MTRYFKHAEATTKYNMIAAHCIRSVLIIFTYLIAADELSFDCLTHVTIIRDGSTVVIQFSGKYLTHALMSGNSPAGQKISQPSLPRDCENEPDRSIQGVVGGEKVNRSVFDVEF